MQFHQGKFDGEPRGRLVVFVTPNSRPLRRGTGHSPQARNGRRIISYVRWQAAHGKDVDALLIKVADGGHRCSEGKKAMATDHSGGEGDAEGAYDGDQVMHPGFRLANATHEGRPCRNLYMQTFEKVVDDPTLWISRPPELWHHLATIASDKIVMYPVHTNPHAQRYLRRRHGPIRTLVYEHAGTATLPETADEAVSHIQRKLGFRMFNDCEYGLGLIKELDLFWQGLASVAGADTLVVTSEGTSAIDGRMVRVSEAELDGLRRRFDRVKRVARENAKVAARWIVRNDLLPRLDPQRFPQVIVEPVGSQLVELRRETGRGSVAAARRARQSSVTAVRNNLPALAAEEPREVLQLHADIERVTLERMIDRFDEMLLQEDLTEPRWQRFFEDNIFILKLLFARPVRLLHTQFHAEGSGLSGSGAQIGDFLLAEQGQALAIVEIKKPATHLIGSRYRNSQVFSPSTDLAGAVTQVLIQQNAMRVHWHRHRSDDLPLAESRADAIRCVVVAGKYPVEEAHRRSFEIFRNACKDVDVITFDELLGKLQLLRQHLTPQAPATANEDLF